VPGPDGVRRALTGTHGGDWRQQPISDSVVAMHLVADGGDHYWIEPNDNRNEIRLTDDAKLHTTMETFEENVFNRPGQRDL
jgi:hypothetical protein